MVGNTLLSDSPVILNQIIDVSSTLWLFQLRNFRTLLILLYMEPFFLPTYATVGHVTVNIECLAFFKLVEGKNSMLILKCVRHNLWLADCYDFGTLDEVRRRRFDPVV